MTDISPPPIGYLTQFYDVDRDQVIMVMYGGPDRGWVEVDQTTDINKLYQSLIADNAADNTVEDPFSEM